MRTRFINIWEAARTSFWFLPALMLAFVGVLAVGLVAFDRSEAGSALLERFPRVSLGSADGARELLATIAATQITVAGVIFSITIVIFSLTSQQFGPHLLRNFMRDSGTQFVMGTFIATFLYCLLVLRTIRNADSGEAEFVPQLSVNGAVILAVASTGVLVYFIHHVSSAIQAPAIIADVGAKFEQGIRAAFPSSPGAGDNRRYPEQPEKALPPDFHERAYPLLARENGYLQAMDEERLIHLAVGSDLIIRFLVRPGHFLVHGTTVADVYPVRGEEGGGHVGRKIQKALIVGPQRSTEQDVEFSVSQLVEIAVKALSPSLNDPFTAINVIDRLGAGLALLAQRQPASPYRFDEAGNLRLIVRPFTFGGIADASFNQIRQYGRSSAAVTLRLLEVLGLLGQCVPRPADRAELRRQAMAIARQSRQAIPDEEDRKEVQDRLRKTLDDLARGAP